MWKPVNLIGGSYADDTLPWSSQDTCNWLPVAAEVPGGRSPSMFRSVPGLKPLCITGTGGIRGLHNAEGKLLIVSGTSLSVLSTAGVLTAIGTVPGTGPVYMAHNQITGGNEVVVVNGQDGFVYNTVTAAFGKITNAAYPGAISVDYINSYLIQIEPQRRYWFYSELADATKYLTTSTYESEVSPDLLVGLIVDHLEVIVFSERSCEVFENTGQPSETFSSKRIVIEQGCASGASIRKIDNSVLFLGNDGIVYRLNNYVPTRISNTPIEQALSKCDLSKAFALTYSDRGHKIYYLTLPDGRTWGYDVASGMWHRRQSHGMNRWRLSSLVYWGGRWVGGDFQTGILYELDWNYMLEGSKPLVRERTGGVRHASGRRVGVDAVLLEFDTGAEITTPQVAPWPVGGGF